MNRHTVPPWKFAISCLLLFLGIPRFSPDAWSALNPRERDQLRYRLENLWNEVDLAVKNHRTDERDLARQEKEMRAMGVYEKIPLLSNTSGASVNPLPPLRQNLARSAQAFGLKLDWIRLLGASKMTNPVPHRVYTDQRDFRLTEDQLITRLKVDFEVSGQEESLRRWKEAWQAIRSPDPRDGDDASTPIPPWLENARIRQDGVNRWRIQAIGFVFRDIRFPRLEPRDPVQLLPEWARERPEDFKAQEPLLWSFVERTKLRLPEAAPLYRTRERFLLNDARWRFFNSRVMSKRPS